MTKRYTHMVDYDNVLAEIGKKVDFQSSSNIMSLLNYFLQLAQDNPHLLHQLIPGTNRGTIPIDLFNQELQKNGSCFAVYVAAVNYLNTQLDHLKISTNIKLDQFLISDLVPEYKLGQTFQEGLKYNALTEKDRVKVPINKGYYDPSKILNVFSVAHYLASQRKASQEILSFYDDYQGLIDAMMGYFKKNTDLLPSTVILKIYLSNCSTPFHPDHALKATIKGTGRILDYTHPVRAFGDTLNECKITKLEEALPLIHIGFKLTVFNTNPRRPRQLSFTSLPSSQSSSISSESESSDEEIAAIQSVIPKYS